MYLRCHRKCLNLMAHAIRLFLAILIASVAEPAEAKTSTVSGVIFTLGSDQKQTVWPNARVSLKNLDTNSEIATVSNDLGTYAFVSVLYGNYEITVTLAGFEPVTKHLTIGTEHTRSLDFQLTPQGQKETITVNADDAGVDLTSSFGGTPALNAKPLKSLVQLNQDFQDALPMLPGVVRGLDGLIRIKGGRTNQANTLVNSASVTDPLPASRHSACRPWRFDSVQVLSNPFSSEYGQFASGVVDVDTRGGTDEWKWLFEDPVPRFRWIDRPHARS